MHLFGLTGGIASGKSTVAARLRERGVPVIDADALAREVVAPGTEGLRAVAEAFGAGVLGQDGALDRKALGRVVFGDDAALRRLEALTHPRIAALARKRTTELGAAGEPLAAYEATLIVEKGMADGLRPLVVAACPAAAQIARLRARDGLTEAEALARIAAQARVADKIAAADHVVDTSGTLAETAERADAALRAICGSLGLDPGRYGLP